MDIVEQQKASFPTITRLIRDSRFAELSLEVQRVNGMSAMIRDDANELIGVLANPGMKVDRPDYD